MLTSAALLASVRAPVIKNNVIFGTALPTPGAIRGEVFELPTGTDRLPDFGKLKPFATLFSASWNVSPRPYKEGFPGVADRIEWFAIRWEGPITVAKGGIYNFKVLSDDGARLSIDGNLVVNDDGLHPPTEANGSTALGSGQHSLLIEYFQGPRYDIALQIWVSSATLQQQILTTSF